MQESNEKIEKPFVRDWKPFLVEAIEWSLNAAADGARNHPYEIAVVERVRGFVRKRFAELEVEQLRLDDVLFTFALLARALARNAFEKVQTRYRAGQ